MDNTLEALLQREEEIISAEEVNTFLQTFQDEMLIRAPHGSGSEIGTMFCQNTHNCNSTAGKREMNAAINSLPIFFVIGHSSYDIYIERGEDDSLKLVDPPNSKQDYFNLPIQQKIENNHFVVYTTAAGSWGLLGECEDHGHILQNTDNQLRNILFNDAYNYTNRINVEYLREQADGQVELPPLDFTPAFFIPGSRAIEKGHEFSGTPLSGGGFGIIRINNTNSAKTNKAQALLNDWNSRLDDDASDVEKIYYLSDDGWLTSKDEAVLSLLKQKTRNKKQVYMSEIIQSGDPGIYIALSCGSLVVYLKNKQRGEFEYLHISGQSDPRSTYFKLYSGLEKKINQIIAPINGREWDVMTNKLNYQERVHSREQQSSVSTLSHDVADEEMGAHLIRQQENRGSVLTREERRNAIATAKEAEDYVSDDWKRLKGGKRSCKGKYRRKRRRKKRRTRRKKLRRRKTRRKRRRKHRKHRKHKVNKTRKKK